MTHIKALRNHGFTAGLSPEQIDRLASLATEVSFAEGEIILMNGQPSSACYWMLSGSVAVELATTCLSVCIQAVGPGEAFGWSALLDHQDTLFRVRAREASTALRIDSAPLAEACRQDPVLGVEMLRRMLRIAAGRIAATEAKVAELCGVRIATHPS